ncbi:FAD-binding domain [Oligoflexus tunisiensis]|uniref:FAD-binding domain n=1 Tax=Oligoflexus tunisiensis TaxID=708132 RepID=UPI000B1F60FC|nr:FAD-binding domain [Oligoflexus tunisiensis]
MKVAINGIGIAGPTLAWWLKRFGHEPVLFEKSPVLRTGGYLIDFWGIGYDIAEKMGVLPEVNRQGYLISDMQMVDHEGKRVARLDFEIMRTLVNNRLTSILRGDLAEILFNACKGVDARSGVSITGIQDLKDSTRVQFSDGSEDAFDLVIGADGLHSKVRSLVFGDEAQFEKPLGYYVTAFKVKGYPYRDDLKVVSHTISGKQVIRASLRDDVTVFLLICRAECIEKVPETMAEIRATSQQVFGEMGWETREILAHMQDEEIYFDRVSQIRMTRWAKGRVALVGDAVACASLLAGEGTGLAMTEAYVLAGELHRNHGNFAVAFQNYERILQSFLAGKQKSAIQFAEFFAPRSQLHLLLRNLGARLSNIPWVANHFVVRSFRDDVILPEYENI